jgi:putative hydrolase of the HAD superfamily
LTNNWVHDDPEAAEDRKHRELAHHFDHFIESRAVGLRKPDPRIYHLACERLGVAPELVVFLDDIGANLKAARALGMTTIKVEDPETALAELEVLLEMSLR